MPETRKPQKRVEMAVVVGILLVTAGILMPVLRSSRIYRDIGTARQDLQDLSFAVHRFLADTGVGPTRSADGNPRGLLRLLGTGPAPIGIHFHIPSNLGFLDQHLTLQEAPGLQAYPGWKGPYWTPKTDPWGRAYVLIAYPMGRMDERDVILLSAGPDGTLNSSYESPLDAIPVGDDLIEVVFDKSHDRPEPLF